jgi:23S rRNA (guanosine2251-2'-O)-methyltransferase
LRRLLGNLRKGGCSLMRQLRDTELKRFLRGYRKAHPVERQIVLLLQSVAYPVNVGSIFRIADACGIEEVILTGITPIPPHPTISKVARGKEQRVRWRYVQDPQEAIVALKGEGYAICALEITDQAVPYYAFGYPARVCLVLGHEDHGVTRQTLALCDAAVFVPMYGKGRSLNVHVCLGVVCYHILHSDLTKDRY